MSFRVFPKSRQDWLRLCFLSSLTLVIGMNYKEMPIYDRSGGREGFHWSYYLVLLFATILLMSSASKMPGCTVKVIGYGVGVASIFWSLARPVY